MIGPFGLRDVLALRQLQPRGVVFDLKRVSLATFSPASAAVAAYFTHNQLGARTCVLRRPQSEPCGFVQVRPGHSRMEWELAFLAPAPDAQDGADTWHRLLTHLLILAAQQGIQRIYARPPEEVEIETLMRRVGFGVVAREEVFVLREPMPTASRPKGLRDAQPGDASAFLKLHQALLPPAMRHVEGPLADGNGTGSVGTPYSHQDADLVWDEGGAVLAHLSLYAGRKGLWLDASVHPDRQADAAPYIKYVLSLAEASADRPVYCTVPDYSVGLGWVLRALGLSSHVRQVVLVAHTMARAGVRHPLSVAGLEGGIESAQRCAQIETVAQVPPITPARGHRELVCH